MVRKKFFKKDTPVAFPQPGHFDYDLRIKQMDATGIDISIVIAYLSECLLGWGRK